LKTKEKFEFFHGIHGRMANFKVWVLMFFIAFGLDQILNKQKIIKKIVFLGKMAKIASFRPNRKIFSGFVTRPELKKKYREILRKDQISMAMYSTSTLKSVKTNALG
jgi:hypothetical protein